MKQNQTVADVCRTVEGLAAASGVPCSVVLRVCADCDTCDLVELRLNSGRFGEIYGVGPVHAASLARYLAQGD